ncbi:F-box protein PP2-B15-like [Olea europaea var. sylvestris]|uniref:F-box protein PP2-B15-like n=1 Tax=Olea europaea var. sylvestris TaxID=158386 RepID=UPI000C1D7C7F|nr:F-box protein PP2-B15-like [Olea europaea var. sylvestris]
MVVKQLDDLPEDCLSHVIGFTSPRDACRFMLASTTFCNSVESDLLWDKFLPHDYLDIISKLVSPVKFSSKRDLFFQLSTPLLIDGGNKTFAIDKFTNKKCYMLSARELSIAWANYPLYWCWKRLLQSRFLEGVELIMVCWLEIQGTINTRTLSPDTIYGAYLIVNLAGRAFGLDSLPSEVSIEVGNYRSRRNIYLRHNKRNKQECEHIINIRHKIDRSRLRSRSKVCEVEECFLHERKDGWLEVELGEFYCDGKDREVKMSLKEVKGEHLKGGLIVEGIELRPKF